MKLQHKQKIYMTKRTEFRVGRDNVKWKPLLDPQKVMFTSLPLNLDFMKQFVIALQKESAAFKPSFLSRLR